MKNAKVFSGAMEACDDDSNIAIASAV